MNNTNFIVLIFTYNVEKFIAKTINSIIAQNYNNYSIVITDDHSTDSTTDILKSIDSDKITLYSNSIRKYKLQNIVDILNKIQPNPDDVIVMVDGDDYLYSNHVFNIIDKAYNNSDILLTYGSFIRSDTGEKPSDYRMYDKQVISSNSYRKDGWRASHLKTFKYKLWQQIDHSFLKDNQKNYYKVADDLAFMFTMLELSGGRFSYIKDILYVWNRNNPLSDHNIMREYQINTAKEIRNKKPCLPKF